MMPLPEDEETSGTFCHFMTSSGNVRRNSLADFTNVMSNGKIAMKLSDGDKLVRVRTCTENDDILLSAKGGKVIRSVTAVRILGAVINRCAGINSKRAMKLLLCRWFVTLRLKQNSGLISPGSEAARR